MPALTPLDPWIAARLGGNGPVTREAVDAWQAARLRETVTLAKTASPFYAAHLAGVDAASLASPAHVAALPLLTEDTLRREGQRLLCAPQDAVARVVSLHSSGTTGPAKRLFFSDADLELTLDFFAHGMPTFTRPGHTVCILLPGQSPDSVGDLLARALALFGARGFIHGLAPDPAAALHAAAACRADVIVGFPVQVLAMARLAEATHARVAPVAVLLCSDYVPRAVEREVERIWGCPAHSHWGTVETGLGGGVSCAALDGCHLREADLLVEVLAPDGTPPARWRVGRTRHHHTHAARHAAHPLLHRRPGPRAARYLRLRQRAAAAGQGAGPPGPDRAPARRGPLSPCLFWMKRCCLCPACSTCGRPSWATTATAACTRSSPPCPAARTPHAAPRSQLWPPCPHARAYFLTSRPFPGPRRASARPNEPYGSNND